MTTDVAIAEHDRLSAIPEAELKLPQPKVEYYEGRTEGWDWFGTPRWWEKFIVWDNGFDGLMQPVCRRLWRWNGSSQVIRTDYEVHLKPVELLSLANPKGANDA